MIQANLLPFPSSATKSTRNATGAAVALTGIADTKVFGRDRIDVKFAHGEFVTDWLPMNVRDFLHFGHFVLALRTAMDNGLLTESRIDRERLRKSWEPRSDLVEWKLCNPAPDCD